MASLFDTFFTSATNKAVSGGAFGELPTEGSGSTNQDSESIVSNMSPQAMTMLKLLLKNQANLVGSEKTLDAKAEADKDSAAILKQIMQGLTSQELPSIANAAGSAGVYNSTSEALGINKAVANSAQQAAEAKNNLTASYASSFQALKDTNLQNFLRGIQVAKGAEETSSTNVDSTFKNTTSGGGLTGLFGGVLGSIGKLF